MMIGEVNGSLFQQPQAAMSASESENDSEPAGSKSRALVALDPVLGHSGQPSIHRYAPFVAHLVATKDQHPQTRERRRVDPHDALAAYRAAAALPT
jgi:hypothetical protein